MEQPKAESELIAMELLLTSEVARLLTELQVPRSAVSVRSYELRGMLPAIRTASGVRLFRREDVEKLAEVLRAKAE
jgi:DNA-binding transcriptional MerR regulator